MTNPEPAVVGPKPQKPFERALYDFMGMAKGKSQSLMIRYFLEQIIVHSDLCDHGSVLVLSASAEDEPPDPRFLKLYDDEIAANVNSVARFPGKNFRTDKGLAGLVFRKRESEFAPDTEKHPDFEKAEGQDIGSIYCIPIILDHDQPPFGVVSFHNPRASADKLTEDKRLLMDVAVRVLEAMLPSAPIRLVEGKEKVFIVYGRDDDFRNELAGIIRSQKIDPVVVQTYARTGQDLLGFIESRIRECVAGFVLLTPDDEGRLYKFGEPLRQRARQNVIFEGGYLTALFRRTNRICFLQQGEIEIPSDLNGLLMERFQDHIDRGRILRALEEWGFQIEHHEAKPEAAAVRP